MGLRWEAHLIRHAEDIMMLMKKHDTNSSPPKRPVSRPMALTAFLLSACLVFQGCFDPVYPQLDRESRVIEALENRDSRPEPPSPLTASAAVVYALCHNLDAKVAEIETAYHSESQIAARRRLLPSLTMRYSADHSNHPSARWSQSTKTGNQSLESSYSSDPNSRHGEVGMMWSVLDFGVGYLKSRQQGERIRHSAEQSRRVRQQIALDVLVSYWRASAATAVAEDAERLRRELDEQASAIRDSVEMRILSGAEGARRELAVHTGIAELEQWRRAAAQAKMELARVMGCNSTQSIVLQPFPDPPPSPPPLPDNDPSVLQSVALQRRPELFQQDAQERIAVDEARLALLQMAPNANLSFNLHDDPDKFLEWDNWMTVGARVSWNLFNIPARLAEMRMAKLQGEVARQKGLALAAAIIAQVGIAYSEWRLAHEHAGVLATRAAARGRLVEALAAGEKDGQTRPGEVLQERVRLLSEKAASLRASAEARIAGARLANAIGLDVDASGRLLWELNGGASVDMLGEDGAPNPRLARDVAAASHVMPPEVSGLRLVKAEDFEAPASYFENRPAAVVPAVQTKELNKGNGGQTESGSEKESGSGEKQPDNAIAGGEQWGNEDMATLCSESVEVDRDLAAWQAAGKSVQNDSAHVYDVHPADFGVRQSSESMSVSMHDTITSVDGGEFEDLDAAWMRLNPDDFKTRDEAGMIASETDSGASPEEVQAMVPSGSYQKFKKVKTLPVNTFTAPREGFHRPAPSRSLRPVSPAELEKMRVLEPLQELSVEGGVAGTETQFGMEIPSDREDAATAGPGYWGGLGPRAAPVPAGSLRPPS